MEIPEFFKKEKVIKGEGIITENLPEIQEYIKYMKLYNSRLHISVKLVFLPCILVSWNDPHNNRSLQ